MKNNIEIILLGYIGIMILIIIIVNWIRIARKEREEYKRIVKTCNDQLNRINYRQ